MSDEKTAAVQTAAGGAPEMTAEEILREIIGPDGSFNDSFNALFGKYLGESAPAPAKRAEPAAQPAAGPAAAAHAADPRTPAAADVEKKPASDADPGVIKTGAVRPGAVRPGDAKPGAAKPEGRPQAPAQPYGYPGAAYPYAYPPMYGYPPYYGYGYPAYYGMPYAAPYGEGYPGAPAGQTGAENAAPQPTFMPGGGVVYPDTGVGEAKQRVVYDADWEARARREAARREQQRRENLLRGDSAYARELNTQGGRDAGGKTPVNPAYIDPIAEKTERNMPERNTAENRFDFQDPDDLDEPPWEERMTRENERRNKNGQSKRRKRR
ncbi:MAG: hypothetical protein IJJ85_06015 [Clostridia bacterium]|nr:hypothetical protein [Clostridia bacterium]